MPEAAENYWGTRFPTNGDSPPVALLKRQASMLGEATKGRVRGVVRESTAGGTLYASLYLATPSLEDYQYKLLYISYSLGADPQSPFPIEADDSLEHRKKRLNEMNEFEDYLKHLLSSPRVSGLVGNLMKYGDQHGDSTPE